MTTCERLITNQLGHFATGNSMESLEGMKNFNTFEKAIKAGYQNAATEDEMYRMYTDYLIRNSKSAGEDNIGHQVA